MAAGVREVEHNLNDADLKALETAFERLASKEDWRELALVVRRPEELSAKAVREGLGMSQHEFAAHFGISVKTLRNWEQGHRAPDGPARAYLAVIKHEPEAVRRALQKERPRIVEVGRVTEDPA
jgi:DNA-binding transcriptional regulator YiaG